MRKENILLNEIQDVNIAIHLINLGARLQVLEHETNIGRNVLIKLHKKVIGNSPSKGLLPFSTDWFIVWESNIHASTFYNIYISLIKIVGFTKIETLIKAYELYLELCPRSSRDKPLLSITRAWTLVKFVENNMLQLTPCDCCGGNFITYTYQHVDGFLCSFCHVPSRAKMKDNVCLSCRN